jgi:thymidylate synthase ThyX
MCPERQVYLLDPQFLPPETIAVTFAKTSRSPQSFRDIAAELTAEKSAAFHEKWVVGYGHASVAEHAVLHIAVENASRLAIETLESCRLASFTEKSTRYQKWGPEDFFHPPELAGHPLEKRYLDTCHALFEHYHQALPKVREVIAGEYPRQPDEDEAAWERRIRSKYVDVCRFYLPAAALANVGVTINARALEHTLRKMLSHPLEEVRALGAEIKGVARTVVPTLVKYAETVPYLQTLPSLLAQEVAGTPHASDDWCHLITWDAEAETLALAACLFRYSHLTFEQARDKVAALSVEERTALFQRILGGLDRFTPPIRELEHVGYTFEVTLDQGGYFELKRHRMMTLSPQPLSTYLGYTIPRAIEAAGLYNSYIQVMDQADQTYRALAAWNPEVAAYVVPNAFRRRALIRLNFRQAWHLVALRSAPNAHFSLRRLAQRMAERIREATPLLGQFLLVNPDETWQQIEARYFLQA